MTPACAELLRALRAPAAMAGFDADTWDRVVRQAAAAGLLGRLGALARAAGIDRHLPAPVWRHLAASLNLADQQRRAVAWELRQLARDLAGLEGPVLLLKGAAYAAAGLAPAAGRLFADIDLMVPRAQLDAAEAALMLGGWITSHHDAYDQRYYRRWMHELPPMTHIRRGTVLDLHHGLLPETARLRTRAGPILAAARPLPDPPRFHLPVPADLVLHCACHLMHEGEWNHGLRDLADLDALLRDFAADPGFWPALTERAGVLNLGRPLHYALRQAQRLLATPVPEAVLVRCPGRPGRLAAAAMDRLIPAALASVHPGCSAPLSGAAAFVLYLRSHWLRMPARLLLPHLARKAWRRGADNASKNRRQRAELDAPGRP